MRDGKPVVTNVLMHNTQAVITFEDGHNVTFEGYTSGPGYDFEGLRHFFLFLGEKQVVQYNGRLHRSGPSQDEHRFVQLADGYTPEHVIMYWEGAIAYLDEEYRGTGNRPQKLHWPWMLSEESRRHLQYVKEGCVPLP